MNKSRLASTLTFLLLLVWFFPAAATSVLPISLQRMTTAADTIFHGRVISNDVRQDPASGRVATFTTFEVIEIIKGNPGTTYTIKQIGGHLPGSSVRQVIHGIPRFTVDLEYVVFLPKPSNLGFSSPIGLSQGKFDIQMLDGDAVVSDSRAPYLLGQTPQTRALTDIPAASEVQPSVSRGKVRLPDFLNGVRSMVKDE